MTSSSSSRLDRLAPAIACIRAGADHDLAVPGLARLCAMSPTSLRRHFAAALGQSPKAFLLHRRVDHAKALLLGSERSILDIALTSGFGSLSAFNRQFKRQTGSAPRAWRRVSVARSRRRQRGC